MNNTQEIEHKIKGGLFMTLIQALEKAPTLEMYGSELAEDHSSVTAVIHFKDGERFQQTFPFAEIESEIQNVVQSEELKRDHMPILVRAQSVRRLCLTDSVLPKIKNEFPSYKFVAHPKGAIFLIN